MDPFMREMLEGLKETAEGLQRAGEGIIAAAEGIQKTTAAALRANDEHEDVRETVHRLEALVLDLMNREKPPPAPPA